MPETHEDLPYHRTTEYELGTEGNEIPCLSLTLPELGNKRDGKFFVITR